MVAMVFLQKWPRENGLFLSPKTRRLHLPMRPRKRSQAERREDSQARILAAANHLLIDKGFDRFSLHEVGRLAKCSHELVNFYFVNKDGLLKALAAHIIRNTSDELLSLDDTPNAFERLAKQILHIASISERDPTTFTAYLRMAGEAPFSENFAELFRARRTQTIHIFLETIIAGKASGDIRRGVNADAIAHVCYDFVRGHVDRRLLDRHAENTDALIAIITTFIEIIRGQIAVRKRTDENGLPIIKPREAASGR